jgi:hypothetical protein
VIRFVAAIALGSALLAPVAWSQGRRQPDPPPSRPTTYDPDRTTCDVERIRTAFQQHLQPYADQSAAVLARLRDLQLEMTRRSLKRCVERELLTTQQADQLAKELAASPIRP